jgi:2-polyprenyl-3-methyl-5-hydroxy-6-metoxy-1,4-benzoquinol methylase
MPGDPLFGSPWSAPETVAGFAHGAPNAALTAFADLERHRCLQLQALDVGCGAGRNAIPLAQQGWAVTGIDLSLPMLHAAAERVTTEALRGRVHLALGAMDALPARDAVFDFVIAHGIWNLARSSDQFRRAVREAARVARPGAALFVFTFSRTTLPPEASPVASETFVFTQFSGTPQCFLTEQQLVSELAGAGFAPDPAVPLRELNRPRPGALATSTGPVIFEGTFRKIAAAPARPLA